MNTLSLIFLLGPDRPNTSFTNDAALQEHFSSILQSAEGHLESATSRAMLKAAFGDQQNHNEVWSVITYAIRGILSFRSVTSFIHDRFGII